MKTDNAKELKSSVRSIDRIIPASGQRGTNMNGFPRLVLWVLIGVFLTLGLASAQDHQITPWRHNRAGAISLTFDDGYRTQIANAVPLLNARGQKATFFLGTADMEVPWDQWRQVALQGHEIASHSVNHLDMSSLNDTSLRYELSESQRAINQNVPTQTCISFAYPGTVSDAHVQAVTSEYYVAARGGWSWAQGGDYNFYEDMAPIDTLPPVVSFGSFKAINFYDVAGDSAPYAVSISEMDTKLDVAATYHAWYVPYMHTVPDDAYYINYLATLLNHIASRNLWMATFGEVAQYMRERKASTLSVLSSDASAIQLNLTNSLNGAIYREPLTIRSRVPSTWLKVNVAQGGSSTTVDSAVEGTDRVVYFDVVPNNGVIVLTSPQGQAVLAGIVVSPATVQGGTSSTGTVTLDKPAPAGGAMIGLTSSNPVAAQVPVSVPVLAGATTAIFPATTSPVTSDTVVTITALYNSVSQTASLTVKAPVAALTEVSMSPAVVRGGASSTGTVFLDNPAPAGGAVIGLSSSETTAAQVPASVTVQAGATTATFAATTSPTGSDTAVIITALYNSVSQTASLTVMAPVAALSGVSMSPPALPGGAASTGTVTLDNPAPAGGAVISLSSSNPLAAQVPASVTVLAGATTATFTATTSPVTSNTAVTISATYNGASRTVALTVTAPVAVLISLGVDPSSVLGGASSTGSVTLDGPAPAGGASVALSSSNPAAAQVPASVTIAAGQTSTTFSVTTSSVATDTSVTLSALYDSVSRTASLTITAPPPVLAGVSVSPASVLGGETSTGTVILDRAAPTGGTVVSLTSSLTTSAQVPATVTVAAGQTTATFSITTSPVAIDTAVTLTAVSNSVTRTATLIVKAPVAALTGVSVNPPSVEGGGTSTGTVTLDRAAPAGGAVVSLTSSNTAAAQVPASVTVGEGQTSAGFAVKTFPVAANTSATITAVYDSVIRTTALTIAAPPAALLGVELNPASILGGTTSTGTVTLDNPAPIGGAVVGLTSSNPAAAQVPASVTVTAGQKTVNFTATTSAVAADTSVTVSATYDNVIRSATLTVAAPTAGLTVLSLNPTSVRGGLTSTGTVTLDNPAPTGGAVISLNSSNTAVAQVPASVTVAAGGTTATFVVTTTPVAANASAAISAVYRTVTRTANVTVTPASLSAISLNPTSVVGGVSSTATVVLTGPAPAGGAVINLSSSNTSVAQVPATVTVQGGQTTAIFTVTTSPVAANATPRISATYLALTRRATLTVTAPVLSSLTLDPSSVKGGLSSVGTVKLNGPAPTGGIVVTLSSSQTAVAQVPASVRVPAGSTTATFTIATTARTTAISVTITARRVATIRALLTVTP